LLVEAGSKRPSRPRWHSDPPSPDRLVLRKSGPLVSNSNQAKSTGDGKSVAAAAAKVGTSDVLSAIRECPARGK
jgi:hypothetical protein